MVKQTKQRKLFKDEDDSILERSIDNWKYSLEVPVVRAYKKKRY